MERSSRKAVILKVWQAWRAYHDMIRYYGVKNLLAWMHDHPEAGFEAMLKALSGRRVERWVNFGGQLMKEREADQLRADIVSGRLREWQAIHRHYTGLWEKYPLAKQRHACASLCAVLGLRRLNREQWLAALDDSVRIQQFVSDQVYLSRKKDYDNPFHRATFRNDEEMEAAIGTIDENDFVRQVREESAEFLRLVAEIKQIS